MRKVTILSVLRPFAKFYEACVSRTREKYGLTQFEVDVLSFLHNNPDKDTAREISEFRMLAKANVSQAVDSLVKRGYVEAKRDESDRRIVHLKLTGESRAAAEDLMADQERFKNTLLEGFSEEEIECFVNMESRLRQNALRAMKGDQNNG